MVAIPYLFDEIKNIFENTPLYVIVLETFLVISVITLFLYKNNGHSKRFTKEEEEKRIASFKPEPLIGKTDPQNFLLNPRLVESKVSLRVQISGHDCLNLGAHSYLGLMEDEQLLEGACRTLRKYGVGSCGPRGFYGTMDVHLDLEARLAKFMGMEEAVVYSYGFSTVASAIPAYAKRGDIIFADEAVNFAIQKGLDASRSTLHFYKHNDMADLERLLIEQEKLDEKNPRKASYSRRFLVAEGIYFKTGEICPLPELVKLRAKYKLRLFLDESISIGTLGSSGRGVTQHFKVNPTEVDLISASMENALSTIGGFCVGSHFIIEHQRLSGLGYCFSASLPPMLAQAAISALDRFEEMPIMFNELQSISSMLHAKFSNFSKLELGGSKLSPLKYLYVKEQREDIIEEQKLLRTIVDKCILRDVAVMDACYLYNMERKATRPSLRVAVNRLLQPLEINEAFNVIESVANEVL